MTAVISVTGLGIVTDTLGAAYTQLMSAIDQDTYNINALATEMLPTNGTPSTIFPSSSDLAQAMSYYQALSSMTSSSSGTSALGLNNASTLSFSTSSSGIFNRSVATSAAFRSFLTNLDSLIYNYSNNTIANFLGYLSSTSLQVGVSFNSLYYYVRQTQLPASSVFAPTGVIVGTMASGVFTAGNFPKVNGYLTPAPTTDAYGNNVYLGGSPVAQGFAPCQTINAVTTAVISGTCLITATALNQSGVSSTWTGTLDNLGSGVSINLTPSVSGNYLNGPLTALSFTGTATSPSFVVETVGLR